ncbi:MAG: alpha-L-fucosidase [Planctomycetes bacterium]|nr:alpha-L-fucosidase [Planctomycetota bacterium]
MSDPKPTQAQHDWMQLGYGMFIHFGPNTLTSEAWGDGKFPAEKLDFPKLDVAQWAGTAAEAGMKYAVLTSKHHDGLCLWPSKYTDYCVKNSPSKTDIVALFVEEFRKAGLKVGLYYSLLDKNYPQFEDDDANAEYMQNQATELLTNYGEILQLWFDGGWDKEHPTGDWPFDPAWKDDPRSGYSPGTRWQWKELYQLIRRLQPNCLVFNNSSSDRPGTPRYFPIDARTAEHFDFLYEGRIVPVITDPIWENDEGEKVYLPLEYCASLNQGWFWREKGYLHPSVATICGWYRTARATEANLLLNVGPSAQGLMPDYNREYLTRAANELGL